MATACLSRTTKSSKTSEVVVRRIGSGPCAETAKGRKSSTKSSAHSRFRMVAIRTKVYARFASIGKANKSCPDTLCTVNGTSQGAQPVELQPRLRLFNSMNLVSGQTFQNLLDAAGPANFKPLDVLERTETEVRPLIARRLVTGAGRYDVVLGAAVVGDHFQLRADRHAVALGPHQVKLHPVIRVGRCIAEDSCWIVQARGDNVQMPGVE